MKLSPSEKQALLGPLVVGCLLGAFVAYCFVAFDSELRLNGISVSRMRSVAEAAFGFLLSVVFTVCLLGVLPIIVHRRRAKGRPNA